MHKHNLQIKTKLTSIPERIELEEDYKIHTKWVPKKKHEVLKVKYKCLKKLFQLYDASLADILPEYCESPEDSSKKERGGTKGERSSTKDEQKTGTNKGRSGTKEEVTGTKEDERKKCRRHLERTEIAAVEDSSSSRKRRSNRTKTDVFSDASDVFLGEVTVDKKLEASSTLQRDLNVQCSCNNQIVSGDAVKSDKEKDVANLNTPLSSGDQVNEQTTPNNTEQPVYQQKLHTCFRKIQSPFREITKNTDEKISQQNYDTENNIDQQTYKQNLDVKEILEKQTYQQNFEADSYKNQLPFMESTKQKANQQNLDNCHKNHQELFRETTKNLRQQTNEQNIVTNYPKNQPCIKKTARNSNQQAYQQNFNSTCTKNQPPLTKTTKNGYRQNMDSTYTKNQQPSTKTIENTEQQALQQNFYNNYYSNQPQFFEKIRLTKFQFFISRILGLKLNRSRKYLVDNGRIYAASDNNFTETKRCRAKGFRFTMLRRPKKIQSEISLRELKSPVLMNYMHWIQKHCLMDTTRRRCPVAKCSTMLHGIINYNDHLNLCHFLDRKHICRYCHEGFQTESGKYTHENEHFGNPNIEHFNPNLCATPNRQSVRKACITQTDPEPQSEIPQKLKKIVSFFDKIVDSDKARHFEKLKKQSSSESNLKTLSSSRESSEFTESSVTDFSSESRISQILDRHRNTNKNKMAPSNSEISSTSDTLFYVCHLCGKEFDLDHQLSRHIDLEHRVQNNFPKLHRCSHRPNCRRSYEATSMSSEPGDINVQTVKLKSRQNENLRHETAAIHRQYSTESTKTYTSSAGRQGSLDTLSDPSKYIIYYESLENEKKANVIKNIDKSGKRFSGYKWESGTEIIRV